METSQYFERTLFYDRSPAADEYYERSADLIFEKDASKALVEVRYQPNIDFRDQKSCRRGGKLGKEQKDKKGLHSKRLGLVNPAPFSQTAANGDVSEKGDTSNTLDYGLSTQSLLDLNEASESDDAPSLSSRASSTALPTALDQRQGDSVPPMYPGLPKLTVDKVDPSNMVEFIQRTKNDFRVFYLRQRHSYSRIQITKQLFEQLLKSCNVFPRFNEYLIGFGSKKSDAEVGPPPLKFRPLCTAHSNAYRGFECSYILRYVEFTNRPGGKKPWSLRQFAVYHRYKPSQRSRCSTWILVGASQRTELRLDRYTRSIDDLIQANPFELHVIFLDTAIASWRPHLVYLTQLVTYQSNKAIGIMIGDDNASEQLLSIEVEDHQDLKQIEDEVSDLMLCLDSTLDTVSTFEEMYDHFRSHQDDTESIRESPSRSVYGSDAVVFALKEKAKEILYTRKKAEALLSKVQNTRTLISSLLERQSGHNIDQQIAALHKLERQGQDENVIMRQLAEKSSHDSSSMRILTIITMIYLPCTIVSNFYSTQFVTSKELDTGGTKLEYTTNAWLFFAISVPLTTFTIIIWYIWVNSARLLQFVLNNGRTHAEKTDRHNRLFETADSFIGLPR
ncbi:Nn.00g064240.m01.CDS01 [Neocucurbitaria sp. VM-36]